MKILLPLLAILIVACAEVVPDKIEVTGGTQHTIGLDLDSWTDIFEKSCRAECLQELPVSSPQSVINACVDSCIGTRISEILEFINDSSETSVN